MPLDDTTLKTCNKCKRELPETREYFHRNGDRLRAQCKRCMGESAAAYHAENKEDIAARAAAYCAENKEDIAARRAAYRAENKEDFAARAAAYRAENKEDIAARAAVYYAENKEYIAARMAAYRADNKERIAAQRAAYQAAHPEKGNARTRNRLARIVGNGGTHAAVDIQAQYDRQKGRCYYCDTLVGDDYHVDHVIPLILGGSNGPDNLVVACPTCNTSKGAKHPMDYAGMLL